jgi:hypothetical protein
MWAWFVGTRIGRWIVGIALTLAGLAAALAVAFVKGKHAQADKDEAQRAKETAESAQVAADVQRDAANAADKVRQDAAKQPAPDPDKRNDFDSTF